MKKRIFSLFIFSLILAVGCASMANSSNLPQVYEDSEHGFSFRYPEKWEKTENMYNARIAVLALPENDFKSNINIAISAEDPDLLKLPKEILIDIYKKDFDNFSLLSFEKGILAGQDGLVITYTMTYEDKNLHGKQYFVNYNKKLYIITFTCLQSNVSKYEKIFNDIANSFVFK